MGMTNDGAAKMNPGVFGRMLLFIVCHSTANVVATRYFSVAGSETIFWPPAGIAVAAILLGGLKYLPALLASCLIGGYINGRPWEIRSIFIVANCLEAFLAWFFIIRLLKLDTALKTAQGYLKFLLVAGVILPLPGALIAATGIIKYALSPYSFAHHFAGWWMGNSLGIILLTPMILIWRSLPRGWLDKKRLAEAVIGIAFTVGSGIFLLSGFAEFSGAYPRAFIAFISISWAATRFGRHATLLVIAIIFIQTLAAGYMATGRSRHYDFANIWLFLVTLSTVGMSLATAFNERRTSLQKLHETLDAYRREEARRRASDNALKLSSIDFQRLVETAEEGIWTIDTEGKTTFANERMAAMLGYTPEEMLGKNFLDYMPETDRQAGIERLSRRNSGDREGHDCDLVHKNGTRIATFMHTNPITNIDGEITGALAMVTDVTATKQMVRALSESEDRYRKLIEAASDAIIAHQSGFIVFANPAAVAMIGTESAADLIGRNALDFVHPDDRPIVIERMKQVMNPGVRVPLIEERFVRPDGKVVRAEVSAANISWDGRSATMVIARPLD